MERKSSTDSDSEESHQVKKFHFIFISINYFYLITRELEAKQSFNSSLKAGELQNNEFESSNYSYVKMNTAPGFKWADRANYPN